VRLCYVSPPLSCIEYREIAFLNIGTSACGVSSRCASAQVGKVLDFDRDKGRYLVQMTDEQQLRVKLENLLL